MKKKVLLIIAVALAIVVIFTFEVLGSTEGKCIIFSSAWGLLVFYWEEICGVVKSLANGNQKAIRNRKKTYPKVKKVLPVVGICLLLAAVIIATCTYFAGGMGFAQGVAASVIITPKVGMDLYKHD